jgi:diaminopimelate decarboxylase
METLRFMTEDQVRAARAQFGTPVFVYDQRTLEKRAHETLAFPNAYGLTVRYAMKALPAAAVIRIFSGMGLHIDASSGFEAERALRAGVTPDHIQVTAQQIPDQLEALVRQGVRYTACSIHQLRNYGKLFPGAELAVRINPGLGSGHSNRTNVGGPASSFGFWHEHLDQLFAAAAEFDLRITRMHTHIGSGTNPETWLVCAKLSLGIAAQLPEVRTLSLGGGFKVARMMDEVSADLQDIGGRIKPEFERFAEEHGRKLHLEIEPGTYLAANAGAVVCTAIDVVDTGAAGYRFIKVDSGMTEVLRPSIYGAQHPIVVVPREAETRGTAEYLVAGHCCESGDVLTPAPSDPEGLAVRMLTEARVGDLLVVEGSGAYCAAMSPKNYNSFPEAPEVLLTNEGQLKLIRKRQTLDQLLQNEVLS